MNILPIHIRRNKGMFEKGVGGLLVLNKYMRLNELIAQT